MRRIVFPLLVLAACGGRSAPSELPPAQAPAASAPTAPTATPKEEPPREAPPPSATPGGQDVPRAATDEEIQRDVRAANGFSLALYARAAKKGKNLLLSGTSMRQALGAAYVGARGNTAKEMATALGFPEDKEKAASVARAESSAWRSAQGVELSVANHLWIEKSMPVKEDYAKLVSWAFDAPAENVDFKKAPEEARRGINAWVAQKTKDKIKDLLPQGSVDDRTRLVVTNAIHFKGKWARPFSPGATKNEPFKVDGKTPVNVPTMHMTAQLRTGAVSGAKVLELVYEGQPPISLMIVLPDDPNGLARIEEKLTTDVVDSYTKALAPARVALSLPRFSFAWGGATKALLQDLGMKTAFTDNADFGGIAESGRLAIDDAFHKTWVSVDEHGTEAAAATGVTMETTSLVVGEPKPFKVDRPFLFFIRGNDRILFAGRVTDPRG